VSTPRRVNSFKTGCRLIIAALASLILVAAIACHARKHNQNSAVTASTPAVEQPAEESVVQSVEQAVEPAQQADHNASVKQPAQQGDQSRAVKQPQANQNEAAKRAAEQADQAVKQAAQKTGEQPVQQADQNLVCVTAPISGTIRSVLVTEDASVKWGTAIIEIVPTRTETSPQQTSLNRGRQPQAGRNSVEKDIDTGQAEVNRAADKLHRIEALVRRGQGSQARLDQARANYQDALDRQRARIKAAAADDGTPAGSTSPERIIAVLAPVDGRIHMLVAQEGQSVSEGQLLAEIRNNS